MNNLSPFPAKVNGSAAKPTIADVVSWVEAQAEKADMGAASARIRSTSLVQMAEQIAEDEPGDAAWVFENMERLRERWARRHPESRSDTAMTYASRAKTTISAYFEWSAAPDRYNPKRVLLKQKGVDSAKKPVRTPSRATASEESAHPQQQASQSKPANMLQAEARTFPLGGDRGSIVFALPPEGVSFADVRKFAVHMMTLASDFDITDAGQAQVFGIVVRGEK